MPLLALAWTTAAHASDIDIFAGCDGFGKPGKSADSFGGPANTMRFGEYDSGSSQAIIAACTDALAHPKLLPTQTMRRAHLLRARALAYLLAGNLPKSLEDIDLAAAASNGTEQDALYQRSMAVSLNLLRALAYDKMGNAGEAQRLAREASAARAYSVEVQRVAAHLLLGSGQHDTAANATLLAASRLDPEFAQYQMTVLGLVGDFKGMVSLAPSRADSGIPIRDPADASARPFETAKAEHLQLLTPMLLAYARATTGDAQGARRDFAGAKARIDSLSVSPSQPASVGAAAQPAQPSPYAQLSAQYEARIEARIAMLEGRKADAIAKLNGIRLPNDAVTTDLLKAMGATPPGASGNTGDRPSALRQALFGEMARLAMIEPETVKTNSVYKRSRPNILGALVGAAFSMGTTLLEGVKNTDGFSAKQNPDGSVQVSLTGATIAPAVVREMTLLRAAELAIEAGKPSFVITSRHDYTRMWTTTRYGATISSIPSGYKTDIVIRFVSPDQPEPRAFDAKAVVEALGPYYYKDGAKDGTGREGAG